MFGKQKARTKEAEKIKASIIKENEEVTQVVRKFNRRVQSNGFALLILKARGADRHG